MKEKMNGQMNKVNEVHDGHSSPPLLFTFQVSHHSPDLALESVLYKFMFHVRTKSRECLRRATLNTEI